ncbi:hypothetical protein GO594_22285 [Pseudomonas otitidis]|uniref:Terminase small subunit n=1 Tax=Metapseudomonas otitidis TaxID=319939 RepID=A0A7X3HBJ5_9GAMM|nr:terminase small subunit [Pseudomonas otitidis]MWK58720.1 hypothetical protein [Pseudomonas otitidis]
MALTEKQRRFVDAKAGGASNKEAALAAGYAASSASVAGSRLAKDPQIIQALDKRKRVKASKAAAPPADPPPVAPAEFGGDEGGGEILANLPQTEDPLQWLLSLMNEPNAKVFDRRNAAQAALPYIHGKKADQGKKDQKAAAAKEVSKGKFGTSKPPLTVVRSQ